MPVRIVVLVILAVTALGLRSPHNIGTVILQPSVSVSVFGVGVGVGLRPRLCLDPILGDFVPSFRLRRFLDLELVFVPDDVSAL